VRDYAYIITDDLRIQKVRLMKGERVEDDVLLQKVFFDEQNHWLPVGSLFAHKVDAEACRDDQVRERDLAEPFTYGELATLKDALVEDIKSYADSTYREIGETICGVRRGVSVEDLQDNLTKAEQHHGALLDKLNRKLRALHAR
jgi:hypothetical protein